ncbi:MAG TPA: UDP-N-acetylmuramoyl-L-alanyl-D-glutamate--2,6-diaminopimelate ligase [Gammaproteobacteria bacterium]
MHNKNRRFDSLLEGLVVPERSYEKLNYGGLCADSREVRAGDVFLAASGLQYDATAFINTALERGAAAIIHESPVNDLVKEAARRRHVPLVHDPALREHMGIIAGRYHAEPSRRLKVVAITGTDGKTSVSHFIAQAIDKAAAAAGRRCGIIGTLGNGFYKQLAAGTHTTPDALTVQALLAEMLGQNAGYVAMEASSHGLEQGRLNGVQIEVAVLTNMGRDHLDYHHDLESYRRAKSRLFAARPSLQSAVLNIQDEFGRSLWNAHHRDYPITVYGTGEIDFDLGQADDWVWGKIKTFSAHGFLLNIATAEGDCDIEVPLLGAFNAKNALAAAAVLKRLGFGIDAIARSIAGLQPVRGRMQLLERIGRPAVIVDYAHTPQALETVLSESRRHFSGHLHCVFGCGGNRDAGKRPLMGGIAARLADSVIVTDDNPRHESPQQIAADILAGCGEPKSIKVIHDRKRAIITAIQAARPGDVVLIAGKGHETYQEIGGEKKPFSDQAVVCAELGIKEDGNEIQ